MRKGLLLLLVLILALVTVTPVLAIAEPDSPPQVSAVYVYEDVLEDGDAGVLIDYYLDYAALPNETVTDAYLVVFVDTDGTTQLKAVAPYTFVDSGYGRGLAWIYFTASEVTTYGITAASIADYRIWLTGNPTLSWFAEDATQAVAGAVADDGGAQTDETTEANSAAANDMTLLPAVPVVDDAYYFGAFEKFNMVTVNIGTQGDGTWTIVWEYWDGDSWETLSGVVDDTLAFEATVGNKDVTWADPTDWQTTSVDGTTGYWVRAKVSAYTAVVTQPLGTQAWVNNMDPPKTITTIDQWDTSGDVAILFALRILYYADILELAWSLDMVEATSLGNRLTTIGKSYFENVVANLRTMAPAAFAAGTIEPTLEDIDYTTRFGAVLADATGTATGSPITLVSGVNNVDVTGLGTFTVVLEQGTVGTAASDISTVTGSPATLVAGTNTITTGGGIGNIIVTVNLQDTTTAMEDSVVGTGWDLTAVAAIFGFSRWMFSGIVWLIMSILIMAAVYRPASSQFGGAGGASKALFPIFLVCIVGGILLGLLKPLVGILLFIGIAGFFVGYVLFFRGANV